MKTNKRKYKNGGAFELLKGDPKKKEASHLLSYDIGDQRQLMQPLSTRTTASSPQELNLGDVLRNLQFRQYMAGKDSMPEPYYSGAVTPVYPVNFMSPTGDVVDAMESMGLIAKGDVLGGVAGLGLSAAGALIPGRLAKGFLETRTGGDEVVESIFNDILEVDEDELIDVIEEGLPMLDADQAYDLVRGLSEGLMPTRGGERLNLVVEALEGMDPDVSIATSEAIQDFAEDQAKKAASWYSSPEGKEMFAKRLQQMAEKYGQSLSLDDARKAAEAAADEVGQGWRYSRSLDEGVLGEVRTRTLSTQGVNDLYQLDEGPVKLQSVEGVLINPEIPPSELGQVLWHEYGHLGGDKVVNAINQDRAVSSILPTKKTIDYNKKAISGDPEEYVPKSLLKLDDQAVKAADDFFEGLKDRYDFTDEQLNYLFNSREISRNVSEVRGKMNSYMGLSADDVVTEKQVKDYFRTSASQNDILYANYIGTLFGNPNVFSKYAEMLNTIPAIAGVGAAAAITQQRNQQQLQEN